MRRVGFMVVCFVVCVSAAGTAQERDALTRARVLYNQRQFLTAISVADRARLTPSQADSADLIAARAYLESFRMSSLPEDLTNARERLRRLNPERFGPTERIEFIVGLGEALFFDESYGAAADVFESVLKSADGVTGDARERVLDWWANALDREIWPRADIERQGVYQRIRDEMRQELTLHPTSATASYWLAAGARAQGDLQAAWDAAAAGWVRATLATDRGVALRADLDRLMERAIIPERARATAQTPDNLKAEWERFKAKWSTE